MTNLLLFHQLCQNLLALISISRIKNHRMPDLGSKVDGREQSSDFWHKTDELRNLNRRIVIMGRPWAISPWFWILVSVYELARITVPKHLYGTYGWLNFYGWLIFYINVASVTSLLGRITKTHVVIIIITLQQNKTGTNNEISKTYSEPLKLSLNYVKKAADDNTRYTRIALRSIF